MNIPEIYDYLMRARRDLWACLEGVPDEQLSELLLAGSKLRFHCIKDLVAHVPIIEDSWVHEDFLRDTPIWEAFPWMEALGGDGPFYAGVPLADLLEYWWAVEASTLKYLPTLTPDERTRRVVLGGPDGKESMVLDGLVWHVLGHEMRHTAQIAMLLRMQGVKPPQFDVIAYLPVHPVMR